MYSRGSPSDPSTAVRSWSADGTLPAAMTIATAATTATATPPEIVSAALRRARTTVRSGAGANDGTSHAASNSRRRTSSWVSSGIGVPLDVGSEGLDAPGHERADGAVPAPKDLGDRVLGEVFVEAQDDGGSLPLREPGQSRHRRLALDERLLVALGRQRRVRVLEEGAFHGATAEVVLRKIHDRSTEVGVERSAFSEVSEAAAHPDERILRDVFGHRSITGEQVREPDRARRAAFVEIGEVQPRPDRHLRLRHAVLPDHTSRDTRTGHPAASISGTVAKRSMRVRIGGAADRTRLEALAVASAGRCLEPSHGVQLRLVPRRDPGSLRGCGLG